MPSLPRLRTVSNASHPTSPTSTVPRASTSAPTTSATPLASTPSLSKSPSGASSSTAAPRSTSTTSTSNSEHLQRWHLHPWVARHRLGPEYGKRRLTNRSFFQPGSMDPLLSRAMQPRWRTPRQDIPRLDGWVWRHFHQGESHRRVRRRQLRPGEDDPWEQRKHHLPNCCSRMVLGVYYFNRAKHTHLNFHLLTHLSNVNKISILFRSFSTCIVDI